MNKSDVTLEGLGGGGWEEASSRSLSTRRKWRGEEGRGRTQMAPGPFAAEKLTNTKRLASLPPSLFVRCLVPLISI